MSATQRSIGDQIRDASREVYAVLAPAVLFGILAAVAGLAAGTQLFDESWVAPVLAVVCMVAVAVPITLDRIHTLGGQTGDGEVDR